MEKLFTYINNNYRSLIGSFILAALLWLVIKSDNEYIHVIDIPIEISTLNGDLVLKRKPPSSVQIRIKGKARSLLRLNFEDQKMRLSFPEIKEDRIINLDDYKDRFGFPQELNIQIVEIIKPKQLSLEIDTFYERKIPIKITHDIKPSAGYLLVGFSSDTDTAEVKGPKSIITQIPFIETRLFSMSDVNLPFERFLDLINSHADVVTVSPMRVNVTFDIEQLVERTIYNVPIQIIDVPRNIRAEATPQTISVRIKGGESRVSAITKEDIDVIFNYKTSFESGKTNYPMQIKTPDNISWVEASPQSFSIKLVRNEGNI